jgi:hypothetical protein
MIHGPEGTWIGILPRLLMRKAMPMPMPKSKSEEEEAHLKDIFGFHLGISYPPGPTSII